jgi:hypothetical protein
MNTPRKRVRSDEFILFQLVGQVGLNFRNKSIIVVGSPSSSSTARVRLRLYAFEVFLLQPNWKVPFQYLPWLLRLFALIATIPQSLSPCPAPPGWWPSNPKFAVQLPSRSSMQWGNAIPEKHLECQRQFPRISRSRRRLVTSNCPTSLMVATQKHQQIGSGSPRTNSS